MQDTLENPKQIPVASEPKTDSSIAAKLMDRPLEHGEPTEPESGETEKAIQLSECFLTSYSDSISWSRKCRSEGCSY